MNVNEVNYFSYDAKGKIIWRGTCSPFMVAAQGIDGLTAAIGNPDPAIQYAPDGVIAARPANPTTLSGLTLASLPIPCVIVIDGQRHACEEDTVELDFGPGEYAVKVEAFPCRDTDFTVRV